MYYPSNAVTEKMREGEAVARVQAVDRPNVGVNSLW